MIKYDYEITVNGNQAKLNKDIYLFRGNKNVHYYFAVKNASFNFKGSTDLIEKTNAINAAVTVIKPNNVEVASAIAKVENGKIHLKVTEDLIDEEVEVGDFDLVFDLFDDTDGAVTIPKVIGQFHVLERPCTTPISELVATNTTNEVDQALTDYAIVTYAEPVASTNADGTFAKKTWVPKEKITTAELNRIEEGISDVSSQCKDIANYSLEKSSDDGKLYLKKGTEYVGTGIEIVSITDEQISTILKGFIADGTLGGAGTINPPIDDPVIVPDTTPQVEGHSVYEYLNLDDVKEINYNFDINTIKCIMCLPVGGSFETKLCFNENSNMYLRNYKYDALQVSQWVGFSTQYPDVSMISNTDQASELNGYIWNDGNIIFIDSSQNIIKKSMSMNSWFADTTIINKINLTAGEKSVFLIYDKALTDEEILKLYNQYKSI